MKTVMVSGNFDPFHFAHLEYIKQASKLGDELICVVSNDDQVIMKKGRVNEPAYQRVEILHLALIGLGIRDKTRLTQNVMDNGNTTVANVLKLYRPDIFCRGTDKSIEDIPPDEKKVCEELGIEIVHVKGKQAHGSEFI